MPSSRDLPNPRIEPRSPALQADSLLSEPPVTTGKNPPADAGNVRDVGLISGSGRSPGGERGNPLQYSCLENPHGQRSLAGVRESRTQLK